MTCDAGICVGKDYVATQDNGILIENLATEPGWVRCAGGESPLVKITKHPTEDRYRVLVTCPAGTGKSIPQS